MKTTADVPAPCPKDAPKSREKMAVHEKVSNHQVNLKVRRHAPISPAGKSVRHAGPACRTGEKKRAASRPGPLMFMQTTSVSVTELPAVTKMADDEIVRLCTLMYLSIIVAICAYNIERDKYKRRRKMWVKPWILCRKVQGAYHTLLNDSFRRPAAGWRNDHFSQPACRPAKSARGASPLAGVMRWGLKTRDERRPMCVCGSGRL